MTAAIIGYGTKFAVETAAGSGSYFELGEVTDVTPPNAQVDQIDATHMQSPGRVKESISGLIDLGEMQVGMNYIPNSGTDAFIIAWRTLGDTRSCRITYPNAVVDTFPGFVTSYQPTMATSDKASSTLGVKVAGAVVRS